MLLHALDGEGVAMLSTAEVARRAEIDMGNILHALPVLMERGHLDIRTPSGTLRLSDSGIAAARRLG
ncbi:MAG: hypothetical protein AB1918_02070 [Pseudomonadota bacterium]